MKLVSIAGEREDRIPAIVPALTAVFCVNCGQVSNSTGERCIGCDSVGGLLNVARILARKGA